VTQTAIAATEQEIDAVILALLAPTGDELVRWQAIAPRVPGTVLAENRSRATSLRRGPDMESDWLVYLFFNEAGVLSVPVVITARPSIGLLRSATRSRPGSKAGTWHRCRYSAG
jgi:hypothetical protein